MVLTWPRPIFPPVNTKDYEAGLVERGRLLWPGYVLLLEHDGPRRTALAEFLEREDFLVVRMRNGKEALAWLRQTNAPRLILLNLMLPVMSGNQFLVALRKDTRLREIPVVLLSSRLNYSAAASTVEISSHPMDSEMDSEKVLKIVQLYCPRSLRGYC